MFTQKRKAAKRRYAAAPDHAKGASFSALAKSACLSLGVAAVVGLLLLLLGTALLLLTDDPLRYVPFLCPVLLMTAILAGGSVSAKLYGGAPLFAGLATGLLALLLLLLVGLCVPGERSCSTVLLLCLCGAMPAAGVAGALFGGKQRKRHRRRR